MPLRGANIWPLSVAAYHALGEAGLIPKSTELLYGIVYKKMSKSPLHSALVRQILELLGNVPLPGCFLSSEQPITCGDSEPEPDIAVIRGAKEDFWNDHPHTAELIIEVCVTSYDYDLSKLPAYSGSGVKEVWLVLGMEKQIEVYRQPQNGQFAEHFIQGPGGTISCAAVPELSLELDAVFSS